MLKILWRIIIRELKYDSRNPIYWVCMIFFPLLVIFFFTSLMQEGLPTDMPVGVVDMDNSAVSRKLTRTLDAFQSTEIVAHYPNISEARRAMQRGEVYGFFFFPRRTTEDLLAQRQPKVSFYYNNSMLLAGSLIYKDMRTAATLGSASVGQAKMAALGKRPQEIKEFLQPIVVDTHATNNPWLSYNIYLSTSLIPICISLFIFLITAYSIGTELKFDRSKEWISLAHGHIRLALTGKMFFQTFIFSLITWAYQYYLFIVLGFPHQCSFAAIMFTGLLMVFASQGFGIFIFGIMPSLRMSMSVCALWGVLSFSVSGFTFPIDAMDGPIQALSWLFPMRSFFMIYQMNVFNGYPFADSWPYFLTLLVFIFLPVTVVRNIKRAMLTYQYIP